jgi:hypothetical protein
VLVCVVVPGGCGGGSKNKPPLTTFPMAADSPSAIVRNTPGLAFSTYLAAVDGNKVPYGSTVMGWDTSRPVRVPAGPHAVRVVVDGQNIVFNWVFVYDFIAGHDYRLDHAGAFDQHVRVKDQTAGTSRMMREAKKG